MSDRRWAGYLLVVLFFVAQAAGFLVWGYHLGLSDGLEAPCAEELEEGASA